MLSCTIFSENSYARDLKNYSLPTTAEVQEEQLSFSWGSQDGEINLKCSHYQHDPTRPDWTVVCGKGTKIIKEFVVHFLMRRYQHRTADATAFEILYWLTDRRAPITEMFKSINQWVELPRSTPMGSLQMSLGTENDYAALNLTYRP